MTLAVVVVHQIVAHMTGVKTRVSFPLRAPLAYPQCFFKERPRGSTYQNRIHDMTLSVAV